MTSSELASRLLFCALICGAPLGCSSETAKAASASAATNCGAKSQAPCPLQALMDARLAPELKGRQLAELADSLELVAALEPAGYTRWKQIAHDGALAAQRGDVEGARGSCGKCHNLYRSQYRGTIRNRALPRGRE